MKVKQIFIALMLAAFSTAAVAQSPEKRPQLTAEQQVQMKEVHETYAPKMEEIRAQIRVKQAEQQALLSKKTVDEKAVYANIDAMGELKTEMFKNMAAMRSAMKEVCPNAGTRQFEGRRAHNGDHNGMGRGQAQQNRDGMGPKSVKKGQMQAGCPACDAKQGVQKKQDNKNGQGPKGKASCSNGQGRHQCNGWGNGLNLSDEQKTKMSEIKTAHFWDIQETQSEINLLKAKTVDKSESIEEMSALQTKLAKQKMAMKLEMRKVLTEDQLMKVVAQQGMKGKPGMQRGEQHRMHQERR